MWVQPLVRVVSCRGPSPFHSGHRSRIDMASRTVEDMVVVESCDCTPLHSFATKVPQVRKTGDHGAYQRKVLQRNAQVKVVDAIMKFPEVSLEVWGTVETVLKSVKERAAESTEVWNAQYKKLNRLPTYWMGSWLLTYSKNRLCQDDLDKIRESRGENFLREVFFFITQTDPNDPLPVKARSKHVCAVMFNMRADSVGKRFEHLFDRQAFKEGSDTTWMDFGPYEVVWASGVAAKVKHVSGAETVISNDGKFDETFTWHNCHSDMDAFVKAKVSKFWFKDYFEKPGGPFATKATEAVLKDLAAKAEAHINQRAAAIDEDKVKDDKTILPDKNLLKRQEALTRARTMLANKRLKLEQGHTFLKNEAKAEAEEGEGPSGFGVAEVTATCDDSDSHTADGC